MKTKQYRHEWIVKWLQNNDPLPVDILYSDFVYAYCEACEVECKLMMIGAPKCLTLQRDLKDLFDKNVLKRNRSGIGNGMSCYGFPKWVWTYRLNI